MVAWGFKKQGGAWFSIKDLGGKNLLHQLHFTAGVRGTARALYDDKTKVAMHCVYEGKVK